LTDLRDVPFVLFDLGFRLHGMILNASRKAGFEPTVAVTSSQIDFMIELVSTNVGVAFLPSEIVDEKHLQGIVSVPLDEAELAWVMGHAWRRNAYLSDATVAWMKLMRETSRPSELYTGV
jgi:DNA-binding transcriptional LysR family regulator